MLKMILWIILPFFLSDIKATFPIRIKSIVDRWFFIQKIQQLPIITA